MPNLADIPDEFREPTKIHELITWIRTLPLDPIEKRDLLFLWGSDQKQNIMSSDVVKVQTPLAGRSNRG